MFVPVLIMIVILAVITVLLAIADKLLVSYGECKIRVKKEDEEKEFVVQGGGTLLSALIDNGMEIPASCGGRGTCGYCKVNVKSGGGQILPTEELFISKEEEGLGARLACQVKVKENLELYVPDLLITVKNMVKSGTFDTRLNWRFIKVDQPYVEKRKPRLDRRSKRNVRKIVEEYRDIEGAILPVLHEVNNTFLYLPEPVLRALSDELDIPLSTVFRIATFYNAFSLQPRGQYTINVCVGTACYVKGGQRILETFERELNVKVGGTTEDGKFSLQTVSCIGCCGQSPVVTVSDDIYGYMKLTEVPKILKKYT